MILVTGGTGQVGTALGRLLGDEAVLLTRADLDLADLEAIVPTLDRYRPEALVNCAAYTAVDRAEDQEELAHRINARAVGELAGWADGRRIPFVTFSTDYVFEGRGDRPYLESDPTHPINAYGRTKEAGERAARAAHPGGLVIRTSWVISGTHRNFVAAILERARSGEELRVVDDQEGCPTVAADLARGTLAALERGATGILHLTNRGATTWYELAREAVELAGLDPEGVRPCATEEYPTKARRPAYSVLGSKRREGLGIPALPPWRESLPGLVEEMTGWL